uniref:Uncharacterized protein n=1 Tax=Helianthus annuus TaxID=4232 RepID=A0A251VQP5_HELAN
MDNLKLISIFANLLNLVLMMHIKLLCSGFVQINSNIATDTSISFVYPLRNSHYHISILLWKVMNLNQKLMMIGLKRVDASTVRKELTTIEHKKSSCLKHAQ